MEKFISRRVPPEKLGEFMKLARDRYDFARQLDADDRALAEEDVLFAAALPIKGAGTTQWHRPAAEKRLAAKLPVLTENRLPTFTAQVVNDGRQSKPAIKIAAMDGGTKETAEYFQGRIRQIEYDCNADIAYNTSREQQVTSGRAFLRVTWRYTPGTFRKEARIEPIANQFSVCFGPAREYDCSDAEYCFVISLITREQHEREHGKGTTAAATDFASSDNPAPGWLGVGPNSEMIQKAEYWIKEYKLRKLYLLSNGKEYYADEMPEGLAQMGITIEEERDEQVATAVQYIIDGADILGETDAESEFFGPHIPIVPVWGRQWFVDNQRRTSSLIRYSKDPQRLLNLYVSNIAAFISQMPKSPYFVPLGGIPAGSEAVWADLANDPRSYIYYNPFDADGRALNAPTRIANEPPIMALVTGYNQAVDAIKASMGLFDASIGNQSNETSGIAINSRKRESDNANFHFHDNEALSRNQVGRILLVLIPKLDKGKGQRAIRSEDGKTRMVTVGAPYHDEVLNKIVTHDLTAGHYGVAVDTGQSYVSARQEASDVYGKIAGADKNFMTFAGDLYFRTLDAPGSDAIADRYEKMLPQQLQPQKPGQNQIPPQLQAQLQQMQQQASDLIDRLTQEVHRLQTDIEAQAVQAASRERIVALQEETKRVIALANINQKEGLALLENDLATIKHRLDLSEQQLDRQQQQDQAEQDRLHQASQADADRGHQMAMAQPPDQASPGQPQPGAPGAPSPGAAAPAAEPTPAA